MKQLTEYSKNKYDYEITHRQGNLAIANGKSRISNSQNWEVFIVQSHNGLTINGSLMPPAEFCPSNEQWGIKAWTCLTEEDALALFNKKLINL
jgi:hypothetical protein